MIAIYLLKCPTSGAVKYVGKSKNPNKRFREHCFRQNSGSMKRWFVELHAKSLKPEMEIVEWCEDEEWQDKERKWISEYRNSGHQILNVLDGGNGANDWQFTKEVREQMSSHRTGKKFSQEHRDRIAASLRGKKHSESRVEKTRLSLLGRKLSAEHCAKMSASLRGIKRSEETRKKIALSKLGIPRSAETRAKISATKLRINRQKEMENMI